MRWWGWGDPEHPPALPAQRAGVPARDGRARADARARRWRCRAGAARALASERARRSTRAAGDRRRRATCATITRERVAARRRQGLPGPRAAARRASRRARPTRSCCPTEHEQLRAVLRVCAQRSLAVVPFGGGTSVVGGVAPLRGRARGRDRARHAPAWPRCSRSIAESRDRHGPGGHARPRAGALARRARA